MSIGGDSPSKRGIKYWNQDGISELMVGLFAVITGLLVSVAYAFPQGSSISLFLGFLAPLLLAGASLAMKWAIKTAKERIAVPRIGYIAFREPGSMYRVLTFAGVLLIGLVTTLLGARTGARGSVWIGPVLAIIFAAAAVISAVQYRLPYMLWLAAFALMLGAWTYAMPSSLGGPRVLVGLGAAMVISGSIRLRRFLKATPQ